MAVNEYGEQALKDILSVHPDKEIILQYFGNATVNPTVSVQGHGGTSNGSGVNRNNNDYLRDYHLSGDKMFGKIHIDKTLLLGVAIIVAAVMVSNSNKA